MSTIHKYEHVIWDWNGTLLDDMPLAVNVVNAMMARRGMKTITAQQYVTLFDHPVVDFYKAIGFDLGVVSFDQIAQEFGSGYTAGVDGCTLQRGAEGALRVIRDLGISQSILSASHRAPLESNVTKFGLHGYFDELVGLDNHYAHSKVEEGKRFLERLTALPNDVVLIGDTTHDFSVARELGCDCLLVARGHQSAERLAATGAPVLESLEHLLAWVKL